MCHLCDLPQGYSVAAAFGNVHGVYSPGNVTLTPSVGEGLFMTGEWTEVLPPSIGGCRKGCGRGILLALTAYRYYGSPHWGVLPDNQLILC